ncbi:MAG: dephospho-CoA kinase [Spirochaetia bacterium]|nr:dephospho-CoA kinase [Spirochaetia bacterium]
MSAAKRFVVAVTGMTKSGKSEACGHLALRYPVIDVDMLAHKLYKKGTSLYATLKRKYGRVIIKKESGEINRRILGEIIFGDRRDYWDFTCLVYPAMVKALKREIKKQPPGIVVLDMAVLFETGFYKDADKIIYIRSAAKTWKKRIQDVSERRYFEKIRKYQEYFPGPKKIALSDYIVYNNGEKEELYGKMDKIMEKAGKEFYGPEGAGRSHK